MHSDQTAPQEQSDQGLHCLPFHLHLVGALLFHFWDSYCSYLMCPFMKCFCNNMVRLKNVSGKLVTEYL